MARSSKHSDWRRSPALRRSRREPIERRVACQVVAQDDVAPFDESVGEVRLRRGIVELGGPNDGGEVRVREAGDDAHGPQSIPHRHLVERRVAIRRAPVRRHEVVRAKVAEHLGHGSGQDVIPGPGCQAQGDQIGHRDREIEVAGASDSDAAVDLLPRPQASRARLPSPRCGGARPGARRARSACRGCLSRRRPSDGSRRRRACRRAAPGGARAERCHSDRRREGLHSETVPAVCPPDTGWR